jgi:hypothetical protein
VGRITERPSPENGFRLGLEPTPQLAEGETYHLDWEKMTYEVVPEDVPWPEVSEERIEEWWQLSRGPPPDERTAEDDVLIKLGDARTKGAGLGFTAREMRMLDEIERLRKVLDPSRDRPGWGSRAWEPRPGEVGADGTRH